MPSTTETHPARTLAILNEDIVGAFGLKKTDIDKYNEGLLKEGAEFLAQMRQRGKDYLKELIDNPSGKDVGAHLLECTLSPSTRKPPQIPEAVLSMYQEQYGAIFTDQHNDSEISSQDIGHAAFIAFFEGYGNEALERKLYETAINAFDIISENCILKNEKIMSKLREFAKNDATERVPLAQATQERTSPK